MKATTLRGLVIKKVDLVDKGAAVGARVTLFKRREPQQQTQVAKTEGVKMTLQEVLAAMPEEQRKVVEAAMAELAAKAQAPAAKADEPKKDEEKPEEAMKRLPESLRKQLEAQAEEAKLAKKRADDLAEEVAKMRDASLDREMIAKAAQYPKGTVGLSKSEAAQIFKSFAKKEPIADELAKKIEAHFAAVEKMAESSAIFKEIGSSFEGGASDPSAQLEAVAKQLREKDPSLTAAGAMTAAYAARPDLYKQVSG